MSDRLLMIAHCCRDWPVSAYDRINRCGECGERPKVTDKTLAQYDAEREAAMTEETT